MTSAHKAPIQTAAGLVDHFFRHESARLIAHFVRRYGTHRLQEAEDAVHMALEAALSHWTREGTPNNPAAWLTRVAHNKLLDEFRRAHHQPREHTSDGELVDAADATTSDASTFAAEIADDELRMLFVCCDGQLSAQMQLVLSLKLLCGFSTKEIASRLFLHDANVQKLLERGRQRLRQAYNERSIDWAHPTSPDMQTRLRAVLHVIYLLFNEGYSSMRSEQVIREELCREALRLGELLVSHPVGQDPEVFALLSLMYLHYARLGARTDECGAILLLEKQDRRAWNQEYIRQGLAWLYRSGFGTHFSRYHAEAAVVAEHCTAPSFAETRWQEIVELYALLESMEPSSLHTLNRAIALAQWQGPQAGLALLRELDPPTWLQRYYLWDATMGELLRQCGDFAQAKCYLERAAANAPTAAEKQVFLQKVQRCQHKDAIR